MDPTTIVAALVASPLTVLFVQWLKRETWSTGAKTALLVAVSAVTALVAVIIQLGGDVQSGSDLVALLAQQLAVIFMLAQLIYVALAGRVFPKAAPTGAPPSDADGR